MNWMLMYMHMITRDSEQVRVMHPRKISTMILKQSMSISLPLEDVKFE
uniref:Uncharacterized protein n=1 Tax=Parascaris equorum TaxID=6256 RepID=A0A914R590_PAREQ